MSVTEPRYRVLFVCLGNICRSPMAEGVFRHQLASSVLRGRIGHDSAGTGRWHVGSPPDGRAISMSAEQGVDIADLRARQVDVEDFSRFELVLAMDRDNLADLRALAGHVTSGSGRQVAARIELFRAYDPKGSGDVPDPYSGGRSGFERVFEIVDRTSRALITSLASDPSTRDARTRRIANDEQGEATS